MRKLLFWLSLLLLGGPARADSLYSVEPVQLKSSAPLSASLKNHIDPQGLLLVASPEGTRILVCEVWWSKSVAAFAKPHGPEDASYSNIEPGGLVGVIHFFSEFDDATDHKLRAGFYTMRYVLLPRDRQHETVIAYPDFVALVPAALDSGNRETLPLNTLLEVSRHASRSKHPGVMSLAPFNPGYHDLPMIVPEENGEAILQVSIKTRVDKVPQEMKIAIVLVPTPKHDIGS